MAHRSRSFRPVNYPTGVLISAAGTTTPDGQRTAWAAGLREQIAALEERVRVNLDKIETGKRKFDLYDPPMQRVVLAAREEFAQENERLRGRLAALREQLADLDAADAVD